MPKIASSDLFDLINSMNKSEKKNFKLMAGYYSGEKKYLRLFELIEQQKRYDEKSIRKKLVNEKVKTPLPVLKKYLFDLVVKSLRLHHSGKSIDGRLLDSFADIELFQQKGLTSLLKKKLDKAKSLALKHEKYEALLWANEKAWFFRFFSPETLRSTFIQSDELIKKINRKRQYRILYQQAVELGKEGTVRTYHLKKEWDQIINDLLLNPEVLPEGVEESYCYYNIWERHYDRTQNYDKSMEIQRLIGKLLSEDKMLLKENTERYIVHLQNMVVALIGNKNANEAKKYNDSMLRMREWDLSAYEKYVLYCALSAGYATLLDGYIACRNFKDLHLLIEEAKSFINSVELESKYRFLSLSVNKSISYYLSFVFFGVQTAYLVNGEYKHALFWNNLFLNESAKYNNIDVQATARIISLILHYELNNTEVLPYITRSTYSFLKRKEKLYKAENAIINFIRNKISKAITKPGLLKAFNELMAELEEISRDPIESKFLQFFDYITWLESKIKGMTMVEVYKKGKGQ